METNDPNNISEHLRLAEVAQEKFVHDKLQQLGLNIQQARLIKYIADHPGTIQKDVATYLNRQTATMTNMLKGMEKKGYLNRKIPADNERQKQIFIEPKGEKLVESINEVFTSLEQEVKQLIPQDERVSFVKNLHRIINSL
ncbi:MarR family transcriptional regulator [Limosilactobacillus agrestis]|uniref:MarR family transcriptional regulator n=1 Tax=Limosilactobacillus agrestis TaxID=2759748 RepID=A0A7W3UGR7_9LACO|nr:MarR family transcriptional regulator [Limosilactobacillus agrestis]MBB1095322.1 MarR family transcriptional regulator [Limosilactobacillus agrestis]MBB1099451.1 MarR family transcriptional regulator [Limosilactobacillus agrestis]MCD7126706.1 MarR family transcriptional regulator [Limosilactobacillus agrestis]MCD7130986.1 MarR family transcriptional regulator [Limosilactobacillus agrestis]